jgi:hypothetical protein
MSSIGSLTLILIILAAILLWTVRSARASWRRAYELSLREYEKLLKR